MSEETTKLYGYEAEMKQIDAAIAERGMLRFICLCGPGGIGKTTMLRAIREKYRADETYRITKLLDFDDLRLHILHNILEEIANQLRTSQADFASYLEAAAHLRELQRQHVSRLSIEDQEERASAAFVRDFHKLSKQQRPILLFDTAEKVQDSALWQELMDVLPQLENTVVVLAGRLGDKVNDSLRELLKPAAPQVIHLDGLAHEESLEYFKRTELGRFLADEDPGQMEVVCRLSAGRPIMIDLAVDWLGQGMKLVIPDQVLDGMDEESLRDKQREFEQGLVAQVTDLGEPRNEAILEMSHVYHYFDANRYCYLHDDVSLEDAQALLDELSTFSFVKPQPGGGIRLHDEMQRMVSQYVWSVLDMSRKRRRWLSERMVQFYEELLPEHEDDPVMWQALTVEQLYHRLYTAIKEGHRVFSKIFREALVQHQRGFARMLLDALKRFRDHPDFDEELKAWSKVHEGRLHRAGEEVEEAADLIRPAKEALQELGVREELDTVCNALGYCYRLLGDWRRAIDAYEEALTYSREEKDAWQIAETMNNIANTCRLSGDLERANRYSLVGLRIRERLDDKRAIANSCYVRAMISWETGNTLEAAAYLKRARALYSAIDHSEGTADVDKYEGYMHFRTGDPDAALRLLRQAQEVYADQEIGLGLADSLNLEARVLIDKYAATGEEDERFQEIKDVAERALVVAERIRDHYKIAECHLTLCRAHFRTGRYSQDREDMVGAQEYYELARRHYEIGGQLAHQRNYWALWSVYEWTMGDMAFEAGNWDTAFDHYLRECTTAARFKAARFARALNGLSDRMHRLPPAKDGSRELTRHYCDYVITRWKQEGLDRDFPEVIEECEQIKSFLGLVDPARKERLRQQGADLLARGEWQRAVDIYQELFTTGQTHSPDEQAADAMNQSAWAYRQMGSFVMARRLCQQGLLIRQQLGDPGPIAGSRLVMGTIMWTTGNTDEAARYLHLARDLYKEAGDEVGLARANRHSAFLYFRIGDHEQALSYVEQAQRTFKEKGLDADLADTLNLHARILSAESRHDEAKDLVEKSRCLAEKNGAHYILAEAWLALELMEYGAGREVLKEGDKEKAQRHFDQAKAFHRSGYPIAERYGYNLLLSAYESAAGQIAFEERRYADAFEHFVRDLEFGSCYERGRLRRELDRIVDCLVKLPKPMIRFYADYIITEWQGRGLAETEPDAPRLFQLLKEYREYA